MAIKLNPGIIVTILGVVIKAISPNVREGVETMVKALNERAKATPNEVDDLFVHMLADLLKVKLD